MVSVKNITLYSKLVLLFLKFLNILVCVPSFKSIAVLYPKRSIVRVILKLQDQITFVGKQG